VAANRKRPYAEQRNGRWRVRWPRPDGNGTESATYDDAGQPFADKPEALRYGYEKMGQAARGEIKDTRRGDITLTQWVNIWWQGLDVEDTTKDSYQWRIEVLLLPRGPANTRPFGEWTLNEFAGAGPQIAAWEQRLQTEYGYSRRSAAGARSTLYTILGDAISSLGLDMANPAERPRNRGRKAVRRQSRGEEKKWATPLEVLLLAERCALLSGEDTDFVMVVTLGWTGMRWAEIVGLPIRDFRLSRIYVNQQVYEHNGRWVVKAPKDGSYRNGAPDSCGPLDLPPFLSEMLSEQAKRMAGVKCRCEATKPYCAGDAYMFLTVGRAHERRANYSDRRFRPASDGWYPEEKRSGRTRPARPVLADMSQWPGLPVPPWPPAVEGEEFVVPERRGTPRLVSGEGRGRCSVCELSLPVRHDGAVINHPTKAAECAGSGQAPAEDPPLACWTPLVKGLTPHGLRHGHRTWMDEDGIPEVLKSDRMGHRVPGIRGVYSHISDHMRTELVGALQRRWEQALLERFKLCRTSPVGVLDELLKPYRERESGVPCSRNCSPRQLKTLRPRAENGL
jgi:integrase